jgi:CheY-like chemotaxis protein
VLLVEDDEATLYAWSRYLAGTGARVTSAKDGHSALTTLCRETFDVIVTDFVMTGVDGLQVAEAAWALGRPMVVIGVTGYLDGHQRALAAGFNACIEKPFDPLDLAREIARCVARSAASYCGNVGRLSESGPDRIDD